MFTKKKVTRLKYPNGEGIALNERNGDGLRNKAVFVKNGGSAYFSQLMLTNTAQRKASNES